jgi:hypothetical protein
MMNLLSNIVVSTVLRFGMMNGHDMAEYCHLDNLNDILLTDRTVIINFQAEAVLWKYGFVDGGFASYSLPAREGFDFYPFRQDYVYACGVQRGIFRLGWFHGCYHSLGPDMPSLPLPRIDCSQDEFYFEAKNPKIKLLSNIAASGTWRVGYFASHRLVEYDSTDSLLRVNVPATAHLDCRAEINFGKYFFLQGGVYLYSLPVVKLSSIFRAHYSFGAGLQVDNYRLVLSHECLRPLAYNVTIPSFTHVDDANWFLNIQGEFGKK